MRLVLFFQFNLYLRKIMFRIKKFVKGYIFGKRRDQELNLEFIVIFYKIFFLFIFKVEQIYLRFFCFGNLVFFIFKGLFVLFILIFIFFFLYSCFNRYLFIEGYVVRKKVKYITEKVQMQVLDRFGFDFRFCFVLDV